MLIKMLETKPGSPDGLTVQSYSAGKEYTVSDDLGRAFIGMKVAEAAESGKVEEPKVPVVEDEDEVEINTMSKDDLIRSLNHIGIEPPDKATEMDLKILLIEAVDKAKKAAPANKAEKGAPANKAAKAAETAKKTGGRTR